MGTQLRLRSAKVLVINLSAVGTEVVKNLVLGGLNSLEILDSSTVKEEDFLAQFFLPNDDSIVGDLKLLHALPQIQELNNRVTITSNTRPLNENEGSYFKKFDLVIATELSCKAEILWLNGITRELNIPLYVSGLHGMFGYIINDLIRHESEAEREIGNQPRVVGTLISGNKTIIGAQYNKLTNKELVKVEDVYSQLENVLSSKKLSSQLNKRQMRRLSASLPLIFTLFDWQRPTDIEADLDKSKLKAAAITMCQNLNIPDTVITDEYVELFSKQAFTEFSPTAAILGGCLAQDVIQFLSKKESPINNCLILDGIRSEMPIYSL